MTKKRGFSSHRSITKGYLIEKASHAYGDDWLSSIRPTILARDNYACSSCFIRLAPPFHKYLHVHHKTRFAKVGSHYLHDLELLCVDCHSSEHNKNLGSVPKKLRKI